MNAFTPDPSAEKPVLVRIERWRILIPGAVVFPAAIFGCYRVSPVQDDPFQVAGGIATPIASALIGAHYLWFYYVSVGDTSLVEMKYFGLVRRTIPLAELSRVSVSIFRGWRFNSPHLCFESPAGDIELIADVHNKRAIKNAIVRLANARVPVDQRLLSAKWLPS